jgi:16S rRNA (cytosine967-C5)-methyltransferase
MVDPARQAAYETIAAVHRDDAYANLALPQILRELRLHGRDAAFATELTYGTLRWSGTLDAIIAVAADRDVARIDPPARDALRLGAYQLLHTRVAPHAAVASTVDLVRAVAGPGPTGFANAVLRRIEATPLDGWIAEVAPDRDKDPLGYLAVAYAHPLWIVRAFAETLGEQEIEALLAADNTPAPVHLCARPGRVDRDALAQEVGGEPGKYSPFAVYLPGGAPGDLAAIVDGRAHVQDEGSQVVALALADAPLDGTDERWLDLCAGPGGKAALLGALAAQRGAQVTAVEVAPHRAALVEQAVRGLPVTVRTQDGREIEETGFDRVLVDAPCTGLGALRRRPEARWRRQPSDLPPLTRLQRELLTAAIRAVRPGGLIGYVTCSPHVVETRVTVDEAIRRSPYAVEKLAERQLWPHREGTDAMYLALLRRAR